ncbi:MAG: ABC transporter permease, partial [Actinomycetota bacterium]|nr:ABC transporter permease [Actinomycetota bacterium]
LPAGDPARRAAGRRATAQTIADARKNLGLDQPLHVQYGRFAKGLLPIPGWFLNAEYYYSYNNFVPVKEELSGRIGVTLTLAVGGAAVWLLMGIPIGVISAIKRRSIVDRASMIFALIAISAPVFWLAYLFLYVFWFKLGIAPESGLPLDQSTTQSVLEGRFVMPWLVIAFSFAAQYSRMTRGNMIETMSEDYIRTARAKGLSERRVVFRHGLRSALTPVVTMFGLDIGYLLGGAIITETVFNLPGLGQYTINAISTSDFPAVMGITVIAALFIAISNLIVDVSYAALDPRVRYT